MNMNKYCFSLLYLAFSCNLFSQVLEKHNYQYKNASYDVIIFKIDSTISNRFQVFENVNLVTEKTLFEDLSKKGSFFIANAGIVDTACNLLGLYINNSNEISDINLNTGSGNFYLQPNGFIGFKDGDIVVKKAEEYDKSEKFLSAVQSGPMLVIDGSINSKFDKKSKNKNLRVGVGVYTSNADKFLVFGISNSPVSFYQFASLFLEKFNCKNVLNLESGSISSMNLPSIRKNYSDHKILCKYLFLRLD